MFESERSNFVEKTISEGEQAVGSEETWRKYAGGVRGVLAVLSGIAGAGRGEHTLAAGVVGHLLTIFSINTLLWGVLSILNTRNLRVFILSLGFLIFCAYNNKAGFYLLKKAGKGVKNGSVRVLSWNVQNCNSPENVRNGVEILSADLVILFEPETKHLDAIEKENWSVSCEVPGDGDERHSGIAGYGRQNVLSIDWVDIGKMSALRCEVLCKEGRVAVWGFRPEAPTTPERQDRWHIQMQELEKKLSEEKLPYVIVGDLNSCIWHKPLNRIVRKHKMRRGVNIFKGTWKHPHLGWRARIDHAYLSPKVKLVETKTEKPFGSDHRPLRFVINV
jgi:exonuclease III